MNPIVCDINRVRTGTSRSNEPRCGSLGVGRSNDPTVRLSWVPRDVTLSTTALGKGHREGNSMRDMGGVLPGMVKPSRIPCRRMGRSVRLSRRRGSEGE
jgi:hypothetical protein